MTLLQQHWLKGISGHWIPIAEVCFLGRICQTPGSRLAGRMDEPVSCFFSLPQPEKDLSSRDSTRSSNTISLKRLSLSAPNSWSPPRSHCPSHHPALLSSQYFSLSEVSSSICLMPVSPPEWGEWLVHLITMTSTCLPYLVSSRPSINIVERMTK